MKKYSMIKGLLAKPRQNYAMAGYVGNTNTLTPNSPFVAPGSDLIAGSANATNALATNPAAASYGLAAPTGTGEQFQMGVTNPALGAALAGGAQQATGNQASLSGMLMNQAQGQGPNPAQAMLANATGANVANQAALAAGQRGASANPGLIARQAAMAGAGIQQQAAGQAATLQAQQQLAAQNELGLVSAQQQAAQQVANAQNIGAQGSINSAITAPAQAARAGQFGGIQQGAGASQAVQSQGTGNTPQTNNNAAFLSGSGMNPTGFYDLNAGGQVGPKSRLGMHLASGGMAKAEKVPAMVSPGEIYLKPAQAKAVSEGKMSPMQGEKIPGKAKVKGDSLKNDTVKKTLDEGGVVVKRSMASDSDKAAAFVRAVMAKNKVR